MMTTAIVAATHPYQILLAGLAVYGVISSLARDLRARHTPKPRSAIAVREIVPAKAA